MTIGDRFRSAHSVTPGFDLLRVSLALLVVAYHSIAATRGPAAPLGRTWLLAELLVPAFFVVSGFLITASAERRKVGQFLLNRVFRIMPAFALTVIVSTLVIGPFWTTLPLQDYFSDERTWDYLLNLIGKPYTGLPGVWNANPYSAIVNASLWSIRWEAGCYLMMAVVAAVAFKRRRSPLAGLAVVIAMPPALYLAAHLFLPALDPGTQWHSPVPLKGPFFLHPVEQELRSYRGLPLQAYALFTGWYFRVVPFFAAGVAAYLLRERIPYSPPLAWTSAVLVALLSAAIPEESYTTVAYFAACAPLTYLLATIGVSDLQLPRRLNSGDYSYGIYLYSFPIQQMAVASGLDSGLWELNLLICTPVILVLAILSWHFLEQPLLTRRTVIATRFGARLPAALIEPDDAVPLAR